MSSEKVINITGETNSSKLTLTWQDLNVYVPIKSGFFKKETQEKKHILKNGLFC
jgi:hypothetical protein